jgi:Kelch motif/Galactose oxidase, central domain
MNYLFARNILLGIATAVSVGFITSQPAAAQQSGSVIALADPPTPQDLVAARTALAQGAIVSMNGDDWAGFDGFLGAAVQPAFADEDSHPPRRAVWNIRLMALHIGPEHVMHQYQCQTPRFSQVTSNEQFQEDCQTAFNLWVSQETGSGATPTPDPLAAAWTPLLRIDQDFPWEYGIHYERIRTYRLNDTDQSRDWYMLARDPADAPKFNGCSLNGCGWLTDQRDFQTLIDYYEPSKSLISFYEAAPQNALGNLGTFSIGAGLDNFTPSFSAGYSVDWQQPEVGTTTYINPVAKEASWVEVFGANPILGWKTPSNSQYFQSHNAMIYQVPEGFSYFGLSTRAQITNSYYIPSQGYYTFFNSGAPMAPPEFHVSTNTLTLVPGGKAYVRLTSALPYFPGLPPEFDAGNIGWVAQFGQGTGGFRLSQSQGTGSAILTISATDAQPGAEGTIEINTDPPYAAPSVVKSPLIINLKVAASVSPGVLLAGGQDWNGNTLTSAELWNPSTGNTIPVGAMANARSLHTATRLDDGRALVTGGYNASSVAQKTVEFFNPVNNQFTEGPSLLQARAEHTATFIHQGPLEGDVLIAGGCDEGGSALRNAEIYDPRTNTFSWVPDMGMAHMRHTATELADGRILIVGGTLSRDSYIGVGEAEIFDPATMQWSYAGNLKEGRQGHTATLLTTGQVLIAGGWNPFDNPIKTAEIYTPGSRAFTYTLGPMSIGRREHVALPLLEGNVLVAGGYNGTMTGEIFNTGSQTFQPLAGTMAEERYEPTATFLLNTESSADGKVLFAGGVIHGTGSSQGERLELYDPGTGAFSASGTMTTPRTGLTATLIGTSF